MIPVENFYFCNVSKRRRTHPVRRARAEHNRAGAAPAAIGTGLGNLAVLSNDVVLFILECCDFKTLKTLMAIPSFARLIQRHEANICKGLLRARHLDEAVIKGGYVVDSLRCRCGNPCGPQWLLPVDALLAVHAIEERARVVEGVLDSDNYFMGMDSEWPRLDNAEQREKTREMLREGIRICDRLGDFEGGVIDHANATFPKDRRLPLTNLELESGVAIPHYPATKHTSRVPTAGEIEKRNYARWRLRKLQSEFIQSCSLYDLCCLVLLLELASKYGVPTGPAGPYSSGTNESILRHGSWFLASWAQTKKHHCFGQHSYASEVSSAAHRDLSKCTVGRGLKWAGIRQDELTVVLGKELRDRLGYPLGEEGMETDVLARIDELIRGPQTDEPKTSMFDEKPVRQ
ncbi:hypothetical protein PCL_08587 [Purpureocillium lilacinum]|uniref:Uncharacterized protein n=1 Tax=Purpureocillium lilacinum TaxID=33203 RepID=A0A2U3DRB8_PURLI|nr:hypothetical protein PCL_08587 [Purpureocillium lilacinum]GJN73059.1 hypothetical protein PLICBS_007135 [Purpureocillium lilacinum]